MATDQKDFDIDSPRYNQNTYTGRAQHFLRLTNPLNVLKTPSQLNEAKDIVENIRKHGLPPNLSKEEAWKAKYTYDSAFHPETGKKMFIAGRMSFQVPGNMVITGCMLNFCTTPGATIFWQWMNQSFNAIVNFTNRAGDDGITGKHLGISYALATSGAVSSALLLNQTVKRLPPIMGRFVPFCAVAVANCINIPCMRSRELMNGISVFDEEGRKMGESKAAARSAIAQVVFSRISMAMPICINNPIVMVYLEKRAFLTRYPAMKAPVMIGLVGLVLAFANPLCCALFPQKSSLPIGRLEADVQDHLRDLGKVDAKVYFNKGL